jgi:hypothetical protein
VKSAFVLGLLLLSPCLQRFPEFLRILQQKLQAVLAQGDVFLDSAAEHAFPDHGQFGGLAAPETRLDARLLLGLHR